MKLFCCERKTLATGNGFKGLQGGEGRDSWLEIHSFAALQHERN